MLDRHKKAVRQRPIRDRKYPSERRHVNLDWRSSVIFRITSSESEMSSSCSPLLTPVTGYSLPPRLGQLPSTASLKRLIASIWALGEESPAFIVLTEISVAPNSFHFETSLTHSPGGRLSI